MTIRARIDVDAVDHDTTTTSITVGSLPNPATPVACTAISFPLFGLITRTGFDV